MQSTPLYERRDGETVSSALYLLLVGITILLQHCDLKSAIFTNINCCLNAEQLCIAAHTN